MERQEVESSGAAETEQDYSEDPLLRRTVISLCQNRNHGAPPMPDMQRLLGLVAV